MYCSADDINKLILELLLLYDVIIVVTSGVTYLLQSRQKINRRTRIQCTVKNNNSCNSIENDFVYKSWRRCGAAKCMVVDGSSLSILGTVLLIRRQCHQQQCVDCTADGCLSHLQHLHVHFQY